MSALHNHPRYQVERELGHGGFATVYLAWDSFDSRWVAVKIFLKQDPEGVELCRKEYIRTQSFSHPHIIRLLDFGDDQGHPFIVMPFYNEGTMQDRVEIASEEDLWRLIHQVGDALQYLHSRIPPVLHNDLKPDNFLITDDQDFVLTDFGISMDLNEKLLRSRDLSDEEEYETKGRGPMAYLAPETFQYRDQRKQPPTMASEIWAFGASLYELATGEVPFGDQGGMFQVMQTKDYGKRLNDLVEPLPTRFSGALNSLIMNCLSVHPWERPRAKALVEDAEVHLGIAQPAPTPTPWPQQPPNPARLAPAETVGPQQPAPNVYPHIYKSQKPRIPQYDDKPPRVIPGWLIWLLAVAVALAIGGLVGKYMTNDKGNLLKNQTGPQLTENTSGEPNKDNPPPPDVKKKTEPDEGKVTYTDEPKKGTRQEDDAERRRLAAEERRRKKSEEEFVGPPPPPRQPPYKHNRHPYYHYIFTGYRSQAAAQKDRDLLAGKFPDQPVDIVKVSAVDDYEVYFGNFGSLSDMEAFKKQHGLTSVSVHRHGNQEH